MIERDLISPWRSPLSADRLEWGSAGLHTLAAYGLAASRLQIVWPVFLAFGAARSLPLAALTAVARLRKAQLYESLDRVSAVARVALVGAIMLLAAIGVPFLAAGGL